MTDEVGQYILQVFPGDYTVEVSALGYQGPPPATGVTVTADETTTVDFALELAPVSEEVTVTAAWINAPGDMDVQWSETIHPQMVGDAADYTLHEAPDCSDAPIGVGDHHHGHGTSEMTREIVFNDEGETRNLLTLGETYYLRVQEAAEFGTQTDQLNALVACFEFVASTTPPAAPAQTQATEGAEADTSHQAPSRL